MPLEHILVDIVAGTASATGDAFFGEFVGHLASAIGVRYAFVGELVEPERSSVQTIAVWSGDRLGANLEYTLQGTPCEHVAGQTTQHYPRDVRTLFAGDPLVHELGVESYLGTPLFSSSGEPLGVLAVMDDAPMDDPGNALDVLRIFAARAAAELERKRSEEALRESEGSLRALLNATDDTALLIDAEGGILAMNHATERRFRELLHAGGVDGFLNRRVFDFFPEDVAEVRRARNEEVVRTGKPARFEDQRGERWSDNSLFPVFDRRGKVVRLAVFSRDITDRKLADQRLAATLADLSASREALAEKSALLAQSLAAEREQARRDPLTQALNHGAITLTLRELPEQQTGAGTFAVFVVDVNGMKVINDTYGHLVGDSVLVTVSDVLHRDGAVVGRYGGDEFVVVIEGADRAAAERYRSAVLDSLTWKHVTDPETGATVRVAVSIGIATFPDDARSVSELLKRSDEEMYAMKRQRPLMPGGFAAARLAADDRIASAIGDLVPIMVSPEPLGDKLRTVAHRLAMRGGYPLVSFDLFTTGRPQSVAVQSGFIKAPDDVLHAWQRAQSQVRDHPIGTIVDATRAPLIIDDVSADKRATGAQRDLLGAAGAHSFIAVPLIAGDAMAGVMSLGSRELAGFSDSDAEFLMAVAAQLAAMIQLIRGVDDRDASQARRSAA
ncbi:MAG: diguanylate cyclase [Chloroflexi bacterium]|nr:diguanylate cyclase [Chloroflexota bacterium]